MFNKKLNEVGQVEKYKARLVVKGYSHVKGVDFSEIFSFVTQLNSIRVLMYSDVEFDLDMEHMVAKKIFLDGDLEEEFFMKKPEGFIVNGEKELVCMLKKSLQSKTIT